MEIDRRSVLVGLAALLPTSRQPFAAEATIGTVVAGNIKRRDGSFASVLYDMDKGLLRDVALPGRGHDVTISPATGECVAFARRPGNFAIAYSRDGNKPPVAFAAPPSHHFYGHGVFSNDGRLLFTTENAITSGDGALGVWNVRAGYTRVGVLPAHGIGPHDLALLPDGRTLVVAIGGIATHPDTGRTPLNIPTMQPALAYIDARTGDLLERHTLPPHLSKCSVRHLGVAARDTVVFGCQFKGPKTRRVELLGLHRRGNPIEMIGTGANVHRALRHYVSSVAIDTSGEFAAATSSRGQSGVIIDIQAKRIHRIHRFPDISGIASGRRRGEFVASGGNGRIGRLGPDTRPSDCDWSWDNHLTSVTLQT